MAKLERNFDSFDRWLFGLAERLHARIGFEGNGLWPVYPLNDIGCALVPLTVAGLNSPRRLKPSHVDAKMSVLKAEPFQGRSQWIDVHRK